MSKVLYLTAGAAGMYCGSCMQDNAIAKAMNRLGWDVILAPCYTPIRVDGEDHSIDRVFFGGINVYLQQKVPLFRYLPSFLDRWLSSPGLIKRLTAKASDTPPEFLGQMTVSMLKGKDGFQRKELKELCRWAKAEVEPNCLVLSNLLIGGCIPELKKHLRVPVYVILQGDDIFLDSLPERYRQECVSRMGKLQDDIDGFLCHSEFYKQYMADYLKLDPEKFHVVPLGIDGTGHDSIDPKDNQAERSFTTGYLARIAPEKGLDRLIDAFVTIGMKQADEKRSSVERMKLKVAGWLGDHRKEWLAGQWNKIENASLGDLAEFCGTIDEAEKKQFLKSIDVLCVPVNYQEPKGIYVLEAMAAGVPVVLPKLGAFPEIVQQTGAGILYDPEDQNALSETLLRLQNDPDLCAQLAKNGQQAISSSRSLETMARRMMEILAQVN